jgi:hypothetical protein
MKRGGPLPRYTALVAKTPLRRTSWLRRSSKSTAGSGTTGEGGSVVSSAGRPRATRRHRIERDSAAVVRERSGGRCEIGIEGCWGEAVEKSHRIARGMGGRHGAAKKQSDRPSDLLDSCLYCHLLITRYAWRVDAKGNGWVLVDGQEPTAEPVLYRGELSYLDDAGSVHSFDKAGA